MAEHARTGVQRRTLAAALLLAAAVGGTGFALAQPSDDRPASTRISDTAPSEAPTTEAPTTDVETTTAPTTAAPATTAAPTVEQRVDDHEERIGTLEATTTSAAPTTTERPTTTTVYVEPTYSPSHPTCAGMKVSDCPG